MHIMYIIVMYYLDIIVYIVYLRLQPLQFKGSRVNNGIVYIVYIVYRRSFSRKPPKLGCENLNSYIYLSFSRKTRKNILKCAKT